MTRDLRQVLWWALRIGTALTAAGSLLVLVQHPFAQPWVERTVAEARLALDRALGKRLTPEWVANELAAAVDSEDLDRTQILLELAATRRIPVPEDGIAKAKEFVDQEHGALAKMQRCAACIADPAECRTPSMLLFCNVSIELTPVGDVKALTEAGVDLAAGNPVDRIDVALATAGIGATALSPITGGTSLTIKAGATILRVARKMEVLGEGIVRVLADAANAFRWDKLDAFIRTGKLDEVIDARRFQILGRIADDLGTVGRHAGKVNALFLLRHVETAKDAAALARVSRIAGKKTRATVEILGLRKAAKALLRLADLVWWTIGLLALLAAQVIALLSPLCTRLLRRVIGPARY